MQLGKQKVVIKNKREGIKMFLFINSATWNTKKSNAETKMKKMPFNKLE